MKLNIFGTTSLVASIALLAACATTEEETVVEVEEPEIIEPVMSPLEMAMTELEETVGNMVFFGYDQYNLTPDAQATLRRQASFMMMPENMDYRFRIEGHCDERGTEEYNLALGRRRADAVKAFLVSLGVDASRLTAMSFGKERPLDPRSTPEAWAKNRRGTTLIIGADDDMMLDSMM